MPTRGRLRRRGRRVCIAALLALAGPAAKLAQLAAWRPSGSIAHSAYGLTPARPGLMMPLPPLPGSRLSCPPQGRARRADRDYANPPRRRLWTMPSLLGVWLSFKRLTQLSFPRRFPIVQFPNLPLIVAFLAGEGGKLVDGTAHTYSASVSYLAMTIWAYEELVHGVNWFRHLLGLAYVIIVVVRVANALHA